MEVSEVLLHSPRMRMFADVLVTIHSMQLLMLLIVGIVHHTESKSKPIERLEVKATMCPGLVSSEGEFNGWFRSILLQPSVSGAHQS